LRKARTIAADRIIGKLQEGAANGALSFVRANNSGDAGSRQPTPAMKRFVDSLAKQKGIKPPAGYAKSGSICRAFLDQHAPKKDPETNGGPKPASPAQMSYAEKIARDRAIIIPDEAKASSGAMSKWIESNRTKKKAKRPEESSPWGGAE
jgi:DNA topoisomerase III